MATLADVKVHLRITGNTLDTELNDLIASALLDLKISGVNSFAIDETDPLIKRAIVLYCKTHFGYNNPDAERFGKSYDLLKAHLSMSGDYALD
jgi:hypothetical protein